MLWLVWILGCGGGAELARPHDPPEWPLESSRSAAHLPERVLPSDASDSDDDTDAATDDVEPADEGTDEAAPPTPSDPPADPDP